jgi:hypothetical protein
VSYIWLHSILLQARGAYEKTIGLGFFDDD